jgi:hypothetical protein
VKNRRKGEEFAEVLCVGRGQRYVEQAGSVEWQVLTVRSCEVDVTVKNCF